MTNCTILEMIKPVVDKVIDPDMQTALNSALEGEKEAMFQAENTFKLFAENRYPPDIARQFIKSWHNTHLKMLPIYGLSCRLQKLALSASEPQRNNYFLAAAHNAETSYEDLNLEFEYPHTHSELYDHLAQVICNDDSWRSERYSIKQSTEFKRWIYQTMVSDPIESGLLCNLFSEIYNHGEYSAAVTPFEQLLQKHYQKSIEESHQLTLYIRCHVDSNVEEAHFNCVLEALNYYNEACGKKIDYQKAEALFRQYLKLSASVMIALEVSLRDSIK